ncbi:MAG: hypothetical protein M3O15_03065, partial [Acidobacteriota bacterium]|nr:hypothetical protein [Acidobacteriota bacterium]
MSWRLCTFEPLDVLAHADARALDLGGWGHAGEISPAGFAGSLRTLVLRRAGYDFARGPNDQEDGPRRAAQAVGVPDAEGSRSFRFAGPLRARADGALLLPLPRIALWNEGDPGSADELELRQGDQPEHDGMQRFRLLRTPSRDLAPDPRLATLAHLCWQLGAVAEHVPELVRLFAKSQLAPDDLVTRGSIALTERRTGHVRASGGAPVEGMLFSRSVERCVWSAGDGRPHGHAGLLRGVDEWLPEEPQLVRLGGDGHLARLTFRPVEVLAPAARLLSLVRSALPVLRGLLLYLATPALFERGWRPAPEKTPGLSLVAAAVGRPLTVAGWDLRRGRPKDVLRAVPPGSAYLYRVDDSDAAVETAERFHLKEA